MNTRDLARVLAVIGVAVVLAACGRNDPASLIASAKSYLAKGDSAAAIIQIKNALQDEPNNAEARYLLAKSLLEAGDPGAAETEARKALELKYSGDEAYPVLAQALLQQGENQKLVTELSDRSLGSPQAQAEVRTAIGLAHLGLGEKEKARVAIAAALAAKPGDLRATIAQARLVAADNDAPAALKLIDAALTSAPNDIAAMLLKADLEVASNRLPDAIRTLERVVELRPDLIVARYSLVSILVRSGQVDKAAAQLDALKPLAPKDVRTLHAEALVAFGKGNMVAAREAIQQVLAIAPENLPSLLLSGLINYQLGSYAAAEQAFRSVVTRLPDDPAARRALAVTYLRMGRSAQAFETLEPALRRAPNDPTLLRTAAEILLALNNPAKAAEFYERATALDKDNAAGRVRLAQVRLMSGDSARAFADLEALAADNPSLQVADFALISAHLQRREYDKALAAAIAFEKKQPTNPLAYTIKGVVYGSKRDIKNARASFEQALKLDAGNFSAAYNLAQLDLAERNFDGARKRYEKILEKDPKNEQTLLAIAALLANTKAPASDVKAAIQRAIAANSGSVRARLAMVNYLMQLKDTKGAIAAAQEAQSTVPDNAQVLEALGAAQQAGGEVNQAIETFTRATKLQPQNVSLLLRLAGAQGSAKDADGAIRSLRTAIELQPDVPAAWLGMSSIYVGSGRADAGIAEARRFQKSYPDRAAGFAMEGEVLLAQSKPAEAVKAFREGLARQPVPYLVVRLYGALLVAGKPEEAAAVVQKWEKEHPNDIALRTIVAQQSLLRKDYRTAVQQLRGILALDQDNAAVLNNLAWALNELGDPTAVELAERSYQLAPATPSIIDTYGWILAQRGDVKRGVELLRTASGLAPVDSEIRLHLAKALLKAGDKAAAKDELEKLAVETKATPSRAEAQQMLKDL